MLRHGVLVALLVVGLAGPSAADAHGAAGDGGSARTPVVFLPGITGSKLRDVASGKTIWGRAGNLFGPRDGGRGLALPLGDTPAPGERVEAFEIIERMRVYGVVRVQVYGPLVDTLVERGYVRGSLLEPHPDDTLLVFPYDWRRGHVAAAQALAERLEHLRRVRGDETLHVVLIAHSNAALIARWFVKYGAASLEAAESGHAHRPAGIVVDKVVFGGTAQGGALATLGVLDRGRRYAPLGRKLQPEYLFTMAGLFEALPAHRDDLFFDESGRTLPIDLFDPAAWRRYGWSLHGAAAGRRVAQLETPDAVLATPAARDAWLARCLDQARRVQAALMRDVPDFPAVRLYQVQSTSQPTAARALLRQRRDGTWETLTVKDRWLRKRSDLATLASAPGDRHATRASQDWLSPQERAAVAGADRSIDAVHRRLVTDRAARQRILEYLAD